MTKKFVSFITFIYFSSVALRAILAVESSILITRVEGNDNYEVLETKNYRTFESDKTYVILVKEKSKEGREVHKVLYWIGSQASLNVVKSAAAYAIQLHFKLSLKTDIIREAEGLETGTFKALFEEVNDPREGTSSGQTSQVIDENETRMILIDSSGLKEVEFSSENVYRQNVCFVAFNSRTVFLFCGNNASYNRIDMAVYLTKIISMKLCSRVEIIKKIGIRSDAKFFSEFWHVSESVEKSKASSDYKKKIMSLKDDFYKKFALTKQYFHNSGEDIGTATVFPYISFLLPFSSQFCYVFDACLENIGMFVWIGTKSDLRLRISCAENAEESHRESECSQKRPLIFIEEENVHLPRGERQLRVVIEDFVKIMFQLNLSWVDVLKNKTASSLEI